MTPHIHHWIIASPGQAVDGRLPARCKCRATRTYPAAGGVDYGEVWNNRTNSLFSVKPRKTLSDEVVVLD